MRLRWDDFDRPVPKAQIESFTFGITPETKRPAHYIVDRIQLVREPKPSVEDDAVRAAGMKAAKDPEPRRPKDLAKFVSQRGKLAPVVDLLKAKKPVRVLLIGDSLAQAGTLWNVPDGVRREHLFWGRLQKRFGSENPKANVRVMIAASPVDAAGRLPALLDRLKPQLVVLQFSSSPPEPGKPGVETRNRAAAVRLIDQVTRAGVPTIAVPVPSLPGRLRQLNTAQMLAEAASAKDVPVADFGRLAAARGPGWQGEYYATPDQLNIQGHWLLADLLSQALGKSKPEQHDEEDKK